MKKIIIFISFILFISFVSANNIPLGIDGLITNNGSAIVAKIKILNLNNNFSIENLSNIGFKGKYSSVIKGELGDNISVKVFYNNISLKQNFVLEGIHHLDFDFFTKKNILVTQKIQEIPETRIIKIINLGFSNKKIRVREKEKMTNWISLKELPENTFSVSLSKELFIDIKSKNNKIFTKKIIPKKINSSKKISEEKIVIYDNSFFLIIGFVFALSTGFLLIFKRKK